MKLKSFGCSFIFGSELSDTSHSQPTKYSQLSWPALLAQHLGHEYECHARPGSGNLQICERALNDLAQDHDPAFYVIGWSWTDRYDAHRKDDLWQPWYTIRPGDTESPVSKLYYKYLYNEYQDKFTTLMSMKIVLDTIRQRRCPFIITYIDPLTFDTRWNLGPAIEDMQAYVKPFTTLFDGQTFLEWSRANGYRESKLWHPLDQAHRAAADYMIQRLDK